MSRICEICGKGTTFGNKIARKGLPKAKGGIGLHTTGITKRVFRPNLQKVRVVVNGARVRRVLCAACLKHANVVKA